MNLPRQARSTTFRLALVVCASFLFGFALLGGSVYLAVSALLYRDAREAIVVDADGLASVYAEGGRAGLLAAVRARIAQPDDPDAVYALEFDGRRVAANAPLQFARGTRAAWSRAGRPARALALPKPRERSRGLPAHHHAQRVAGEPPRLTKAVVQVTDVVLLHEVGVVAEHRDGRRRRLHLCCVHEPNLAARGLWWLATSQQLLESLVHLRRRDALAAFCFNLVDYVQHLRHALAGHPTLRRRPGQPPRVAACARRLSRVTASVQSTSAGRHSPSTI